MEKTYTRPEQKLVNKLSKGGKKIYGLLRGMGENCENVFPSIPGLAAKVALTPRGVSKCIAKMKELGLIRVEHKKSEQSENICNHYYFPYAEGYVEELPFNVEQEIKKPNKEIMKKRFKELNNKQIMKLFQLTMSYIKGSCQEYKDYLIKAYNDYAWEFKLEAEKEEKTIEQPKYSPNGEEIPDNENIYVGDLTPTPIPKRVVEEPQEFDDNPDPKNIFPEVERIIWRKIRPDTPDQRFAAKNYINQGKEAGYSLAQLEKIFKGISIYKNYYYDETTC